MTVKRVKEQIAEMRETLLTPAAGEVPSAKQMLIDRLQALAARVQNVGPVDMEPLCNFWRERFGKELPQ